MDNLSSDILDLFASLDGYDRYEAQLELFAWSARAARRLVERNRYARWKAERLPWKKKRAKQTEYHNRWKTDPAWRRRAA